MSVFPCVVPARLSAAGCGPRAVHLGSGAGSHPLPLRHWLVDSFYSVQSCIPYRILFSIDLFTISFTVVLSVIHLYKASTKVGIFSFKKTSKNSVRKSFSSIVRLLQIIFFLIFLDDFAQVMNYIMYFR